MTPPKDGSAAGLNILFVNYGDFTTNSLNHIAGFARALSARGHACVVAVPERKSTINVVPDPSFRAVLFDEILAEPAVFPDGRPADLIHAWTPREVVRKFVLRYQSRVTEPARLVIHLEDNEAYLLESYTGKPFAEWRDAPPAEWASQLIDSLPHPLRHQAFLLAADGVTHIVEALQIFMPPGKPHLLLPPGVDFSLYRPQRPDPALRRELGLKELEKAIVYTGSVTFANDREMRDLYAAVALLNERATPTRLIRTGITPPDFLGSLPPGHADHAIHLGFVEKAKLPRLLALADVLVQPGQAGRFNDFRLPSKLPEFFASGRPIILPCTNLGTEVRDGQDALLLKTGTPEEIAQLCERVFQDHKLAAILRENAVRFAAARFDPEKITEQLVGFYRQIVAAPAIAPWAAIARHGGSEIGLLALRQLDHPASGSAATDELELLALLVRELENSLSQARQQQGFGKLEEDLAYWKSQYDLTRQHLDHVEQSLTLTRNHADLLQVNFEAVRADLHRTEQARKETEAKLRDAQTRVHELNVEGMALRTEVTRLDERIQQLGVQLRDLVYQRDEKIRAMQQSFSWKATAWLRSLRRLFLDRGKPPRLKPSPLPPPPAHTPSRYTSGFGRISEPATVAEPIFHYCIDYPQSWSFRPAPFVLRGWCFAADGKKIVAVRARVGDRNYTAVSGLKRLDVLAALREYPQAEYCGFKIDLDLALGDDELVLEASTEAGAFHPFFRHETTVTENGGIEELTSYEKWVETYDTLTLEVLAQQRIAAEKFAFRPLISVLIPVYNTPERWLRKAVDSVRAQTYRHWELCLANDASPDTRIRPLLEEIAAADPRIKLVHREKNGHISAASNSALELATGDFTALLDHDDEITPNALYEVVAALNRNPDLSMVYSDEDKIDETGRRLEPYFKPDFLPDLFVGQNYTSHLSVYRTSVLREVGGFRAGFEGSQDWDLALRVIDRIGEKAIGHIPKILYHWRAIPGSTALLLSEKNYPVEAARRALQDHFERKKIRVELVPVPGDHWRVKFPLPEPAPRVTLIIPTRNRVALLRQGIESILAKTSYPNYEILVVDNGSDDPETLGYLEKLAQRKVRVVSYPKPFNYSAINNHAVAQTDAELVGLLNNDLEVINPDWLTEMVSQAARPEIGCVGAMLYYPNDRIQHAGIIIGLGGVAGHAFRDFPRGTPGYFNRARLVQNYGAVTAACLVIRRKIYNEVGGLDENRLAVAFNDVDFCLKVRAAGYRNLWTPFAELYHHESASRGAEDTPEKHERFRSEVETMLERWKADIKDDAAYNPNLTLEFNDFSLAAPPRLSSSSTH